MGGGASIDAAKYDLSSIFNTVYGSLFLSAWLGTMIEVSTG